jgi:hypothetical protein
MRIHALLKEGLLGAIFANGHIISRSLYVTDAGLALLEEHSDNGG